MSNQVSLPDEAAASLREWIGSNWTATALHGDASFRVYYRIRRYAGETFILAWYPPVVRGELQRYMKAYRAVAKHAYVARVVEHNEFAVLQQDIGDRTLSDTLTHDRAEGIAWYKKAVTLLAYFQNAGELDINPPFSAEFFANELEMTREFYAHQLMGMEEEKSRELTPLFRKLCDNIAHHPYVLCHRDYHGQNIHLFNEKLYLLDYQDLRMGPDTYDAASLLRDRGVAALLGSEPEMDLVDYYAEWRLHGFPARSPLPQGERRSIRRRYFETLLQRSVKILGTFAKQPITRGRMGYLDFIPPTIDSVRRCLDELPEYGELAALLPMDFSLDAARAQAERMYRNGQT